MNRIWKTHLSEIWPIEGALQRERQPYSTLTFTEQQEHGNETESRDHIPLSILEHLHNSSGRVHTNPGSAP